MMFPKSRQTAWLFLCLMLTTALPFGVFCQSAPKAPTPGPRETCPVCGMFVSLYPDWIASVTHENGIVHFFDGAKDMFKYVANPGKWVPGLDHAAIVSVRVTDYYTLQPIDGKKAYYVIGSDVLGPMGHELIPVQTLEDAAVFLKDHAGKKILTFHDVTPAILQDIDHGALGGQAP